VEALDVEVNGAHLGQQGVCPPRGIGLAEAESVAQREKEQKDGGDFVKQRCFHAGLRRSPRRTPDSCRAASHSIITRARRELTLPGTKYVDFKYVDFKVQVYGNAAIATRGSRGKETDKSGTRDIKNRWTDTWVKMPSGKWQCVASHVSNVK
jgi:hypothetical protein